MQSGEIVSSGEIRSISPGSSFKIRGKVKLIHSDPFFDTGALRMVVDDPRKPTFSRDNSEGQIPRPNGQGVSF